MLEQYLDKIYNCSRCGICRHWGWNGVEDVCPVYKHTTRYETEYTRGRVKMARMLAEKQVEPSELLTKHMLECTLCGRCEACCPCDIPIHEAFQAMRSDLADQGFTLPIYEKTAEMIEKEKNPYGPAKEKPEAREKNPLAKVLYYPGCTINRRAPEIRDEVESVFQKLGVEYNIFTEDTCCGFPLYDIGMTERMKEVAAETLRLIDEYKPDIIVTSCPGCLNAIGHFWKEKLGLSHDYLVMDISEFLLPKVQGKLKPQAKKVTWHDPCVLGRHLGEYDTPRALINEVPEVDFVEMAEHHEKSACCGAGGGVLSGFNQLAKKVGADRVDQAVETGAGELYTSCPSCYMNLKRAAGKKGVEVRYITALVDESL